MKKTNYIFSLFMVLCCCINNALVGQDFTVQQTAYKAYLSSSKSLWQQALKSQESIYNNSNKGKDQLFELVLVQYGLLNSTMASKDETTFNDHVDGTIENLEALLEQDKNWSAPKAILSAVYGLKMAYSPWKGVFLGSKSSSLVEKAVKEDKDSAIAWKIYGNSKLFTPEMWGGDANAAVEALEKAMALFESQPDLLKFNWLYLDTMSFLGQAYSKTAQQDKAIKMYKKALSIEPDFNWVKYSLLPKAQKQ